MKAFSILTIVITSSSITGCSNPLPLSRTKQFGNLAHHAPSQKKDPAPIYVKDFYSSFEKGGVYETDGLIRYFLGFGFDDKTRRAVCDAVATAKWEGAQDHLSTKRLAEFRTLLQEANYSEKNFPNGKQLYDTGFNWKVKNLPQKR